jgi:hypothetical protein
MSLAYHILNDYHVRKLVVALSVGLFDVAVVGLDFSVDGYKIGLRFGFISYRIKLQSVFSLRLDK